MVTNALQPMETVTGGEIVNLGAVLAQIAAEQQLAFQGQAGYYNPNAFTGGMGGYLPTLERELGLGQLGVQQGNLGVNQQNANTTRELGLGNLQLGRDELTLNRDLGFGNLALGKDQLAAAMRDADRQFELDVQRFGLAQAEFNYQQRLGEAQTRLQQLGLLSSLRGPADFLAYNYTLNNMAAPPGQAVDPFQLTSGMNKPYAAPPLPPTPPFTPTDPTTLPGANRQVTPAAAPMATGPVQATAMAPTNAMPAQTAPMQAAPTRQPPAAPLAISGNPASDAALEQQWVNQGAPPEVLAEFERISQNMNKAYATQVANTGGNPGYARGGAMDGGMAIVGDSRSGRETGHEEAVIGDFVVLPNEIVKALDLLGGTPRAAGGGMYSGWPQRPDVQLDPMENPGQWGNAGQSMQAWAQRLQQRAPSAQRRQDAGGNPWGDIGQFLQPWAQWLQSRPRDGQGWQGWYGQMPALPGRGGQPGAPNTAPATQPAGNTPAGAPQTVKAFQDWYEQKSGRTSNWKGTQWQGRAPTDPLMGAANVPRLATGGAVNDGGGFFNFNVHSPQDTANAPFIQKAIGNRPSAAWQARGEPLGAVGRQPFNYANYLQLAPSEQDMFRGLVETPAAMGGYGGYWQDELERSRRSSFQGQTNSPAVYG